MKIVIFTILFSIVYVCIGASDGDSEFLHALESSERFLEDEVPEDEVPEDEVPEDEVPEGEVPEFEAFENNDLRGLSVLKDLRGLSPPYYSDAKRNYGGKDMGCFVDSKVIPDLPFIAGSNVTPAECNKLCQIEKYKYFAMKNGTECSCGNSYGSYGCGLSELCYPECPGLPGKTICGGQTVKRVFEVNGELTKLGNLNGCYKPSSQIPPKSLSNFSVDNCLLACIKSGKLYAGILNGNKCRCGNDYGQNGEGELDFDKCEITPCKGNEQNYCGGPGAMMVYQANEFYMYVRKGAFWGYKSPNFADTDYAKNTSVYFHIPQQENTTRLGYSTRKYWKWKHEWNKVTFTVHNIDDNSTHNATLYAYKVTPTNNRRHISNGVEEGVGKIGFWFRTSYADPPLPKGRYTSKFHFIGKGWHKLYFKVKVIVDFDFRVK